MLEKRKVPRCLRGMRRIANAKKEFAGLDEAGPAKLTQTVLDQSDQCREGQIHEQMYEGLATQANGSDWMRAISADSRDSMLTQRTQLELKQAEDCSGNCVGVESIS